MKILFSEKYEPIERKDAALDQVEPKYKDKAEPKSVQATIRVTVTEIFCPSAPHPHYFPQPCPAPAIAFSNFTKAITRLDWDYLVRVLETVASIFYPLEFIVL